jgi:hypothetical protein
VYALRALEQIAGAPSGVDLHQETGEIDKTLKQWLTKVGITASSRFYAPSEKAPSTDESSTE